MRASWWISLLIVVAAWPLHAQTTLRTRGCTALRPTLPESVHVHETLVPTVQRMVIASPTFRDQCRRLEKAPSLYVRVRVVASLTPPTLRGLSVIQRTRSGPLIASVDILEGVDAVEWIAHELEHVLEQLEGVRVKDVCAYHPRLCDSVPGAVDTIRAVRTGRVVLDEVRRH